MRAWLLAVVIIAGCKPSATVVHTTPVANLQSYRTVALRVKSTAFASQGIATYLENAVLVKLQQRCGFASVARDGGGAPADVVLDLNITRSGRGGGWVSNANLATIETLLVLTDGQNGELLGTANIRGKSSGIMINNAVPENEAAEAVAQTVADVMSKSGCSGPRVARAEPPPPADRPPTDNPTDKPPIDKPPTDKPPSGGDESRRAEAEALNEDGKLKLRSADVKGALAAFTQANKLVPDAKYQFNVCLTLEASEKLDQAVAACREARGMNPPPALLAKIDRRLDLLAKRK